MKTIYATGPVGLALALALSGPALSAGMGESGAVHDTARSLHPTFTQLDIDGNGVLSQAEAAGAKGLLDDWKQADRNADDVIERSEFAAFEAMGPMPSAAMPQVAP